MFHCCLSIRPLLVTTGLVVFVQRRLVLSLRLSSQLAQQLLHVIVKLLVVAFQLVIQLRGREFTK